MNSEFNPNVAAVTLQMKQEKRRRARAILIQLGVFVLFPSAIALVYFGFVASPQYRAEATLAVQRGLEDGAPNESTTSSLEDARTLENYIESAEMLARLDADGSFTEHYSDPNIDVFSRMSSEAGSVTRGFYYGRRVRVTLDDISGNLLLQVDAFDPAAAERFARGIIRQTRRRTRRLHADARESVVAAADKRMTAARDELLAARETLAAANAKASAASVEQLAAPRSDLARLELEVALAQSNYDSAVEELSKARRSALASKRHIEVIVPPLTPDEPSGPLRVRTIVTTFVVTLALYAIFSLIVASIREHARL